MKDRLGEQWFSVLKEEFDKDYYKNLQTFILSSAS